MTSMFAGKKRAQEEAYKHGTEGSAFIELPFSDYDRRTGYVPFSDYDQRTGYVLKER